MRVVCFADHVGGGRFLPPPVPESATEDEAALRTLLAIDADRAAEAQRAPGDLVLMDRSVHTLLAHRHAIQFITGLPVSEPAARIVAASRLASDHSIGTAESSRRAASSSTPRTTGTFRQYFTALADEPGAAVVRLDATARPEDLVAAAKAHIHSLLPGRRLNGRRAMQQPPLWPRVIFVDWHGVLSRDPFWTSIRESATHPLRQQLEAGLSGVFAKESSIAHEWMKGLLSTDEIIAAMGIHLDRRFRDDFLARRLDVDCGRMKVDVDCSRCFAA